ncbi:hypothetical protein NBRC116591_08440 [Sessilibacter corallicola]|uniref:Uncharacterized protein n=1 Tax=Sessilibacter corallicola TaxID=2904075 RepID=A0ABQ0A5V2_9GAMM
MKKFFDGDEIILVSALKTKKRKAVKGQNSSGDTYYFLKTLVNKKVASFFTL